MGTSTQDSADGDVSRGLLLMAICTTFTLLATVCLAVRLYTRFRIVKAPGVDDLVLTLNMLVFNIPVLVMIGVAVKYGLGRHERYLSRHEQLMTKRVLTIGEPFAAQLSSAPKLAVTVFLHKCLGGAHRPSIYALYGLSIVLIILSIINSLFYFIQCRPFSAIWYLDVESTCWNRMVQISVSYSAGALSAFLDLVLALYPLTFVPKLQMRLKMKVATCFVMGLGIFAFALAVARVSELGFQYWTDLTWNAIRVIILSTVESNMIIICASVPAIVPLFLAKKRLDQGTTEASRDPMSGYVYDSKTLSSDRRRVDHGSPDMLVVAELGAARWESSDSYVKAEAEILPDRNQP